MKGFLLLILFSVNAWSVEIPVDEFDQSKLESLLRKIPSALIGSSQEDGFVRKTTRYPDTNSLFTIVCEADYYADASIPTYKKCVLSVSDNADLRGDEYLIKMTQKSRVSEMYNAISFGTDTRRTYSHERIYGQAFEGDYKNVFRFMIVCKKNTSCEFRFSPKEAIEY